MTDDFDYVSPPPKIIKTMTCIDGVSDALVKRAASGIRRLFILRDTDQPMPSFDEIARAALEAAFPATPNT